MSIDDDDDDKCSISCQVLFFLFLLCFQTIFSVNILLFVFIRHILTMSISLIHLYIHIYIYIYIYIHIRIGHGFYLYARMYSLYQLGEVCPIVTRVRVHLDVCWITFRTDKILSMHLKWNTRRSIAFFYRLWLIEWRFIDIRRQSYG
jgi:hypothetical protein